MILLVLAGCSGTAPVVPSANVVEAQVIEVPVPVERRPPADLMALVDLPAPQLGKACTGDYGITRANAELLVDFMRTARERLARWRVWAGPK